MFECVFDFRLVFTFAWVLINRRPMFITLVQWVSSRSPRSKDSDLHWLHCGIAVCFFRIVVVFKLMFGALGTGCMEWFVCSWFWFGTLCI